MNAAFSIWEDRIAPVFDVASLLVVVADPADGAQPVRVRLPDTMLGTIVGTLFDHDVSVLVCGAISRHYHDGLETRGIAICPFVTGELEEVVRAWENGRLYENRFRMPGCPPRGPQWQAGGRGLRRRRRGNALQGAAVCRCPRCGYTITHVPGTPCSKHRCPNCHAPMVRA